MKAIYPDNGDSDPAAVPGVHAGHEGAAGAESFTLEAAALRDFMRFDVLPHELGHHVLQHRARKLRSVRRTAEHERFAEMFARRWKPAVRAALARSEPTDERAAGRK